ncbi:hypothetical protein FBR05_14275 [Deltaproteobacteria bacterium PRO3]|nr:hypothetical protein [Deltaproteobacteria bacterium PRO3]
MKLRSIFLFAALFSMPAGLFAQASDANTAAAAIRDFMLGYYLKDEAALRRVLPAGTDPKPLLEHADLPAERQAAFRIRIEELKPGKTYPSAAADPNRAIVTFKVGEEPWLLPVLREAEAWKVDPRYALAARSGFTDQDPRGVIRRFAAGLFARDKKALASVVLLRTEKELDAMLKENKLGYDDRQRLRELADLMPMAPTRTGEDILFPNGELRTVLNDESEQTFLALIGFCELPFRVKNIDGLWKVVPQPYAEALKAAGMAGK